MKALLGDDFITLWSEIRQGWAKLVTSSSTFFYTLEMKLGKAIELAVYRLVVGLP